MSDKDSFFLNSQSTFNTIEMNQQDLIHKAYENFNKRNIDEVFTTMNPGVHWPKAFEGDFVKGYDEVRAYWTRQWSEINPEVNPVGFKSLGDGRLEVDVHQIVKSLDGEVLFDGNVTHVYTFENGLIDNMKIGAN